ncbi:hypothetical protein GLYMA_10G279000v4, partial [Glycine max]|uniref:Tyrosine specific protein phosphatases domain-containing protein n=1 Tax=Glycine max TaxID=3847 RepID=K7LLV8_SOYBN
VIFSRGISFLIALKATTLFLCFAYLKNLGFTLFSLPFLYYSLISIASHPSINLPILLGKTTDGSFPLFSLIIFSPYIYFVRIFSLLRRLRSGEPTYTQVHEGLYFPRVKDFTTGLPYCCFPTWYTRSPQPADIESAVKWASRQRDLNKPIFVHCAYGHGRSVAVMCALLVARGITEDWKNAEKLIKQKRPYIRMNALHRKALEEWSRHQLSAPRK